MSQSIFAQFRGTAQTPASSPFSSETTPVDMSSRKRGRDINDIDGEVEIESATSSFRQSVPKRSKIALAAANGGSVVSDDDDDDEPDGYGGDSGFVDGTPDDSEAEEEDEEIDELRATQIVEKQIREHRDNVASEQGVVEEVFCRNFMCHSKLRIKLGPLINFIIGHNGSGKSAVLTALTMCLGGSAKDTNRGASLKSMIKEGEESASLAVKIKNHGDAAFKPDIYGRSITVERHFSKSGGSGFKLKNAEDKTISTKKADLDEILDFFAFQLDNPINVLSQDKARQFLSNSSPTEKYKFFIRGTQLEMLDNDYKLIEEHYDNIEAKLRSRKDDIAVLKSKAEEAEKRKKRLDATRVLVAKIKELQHEHAWAQVEEQEKFLAEYEREVQEAADGVREKEGEAETISGTYDGHDQSSEAAKRNLALLNTQLEPHQEEHAAHKAKFDTNRDDLLNVLNQQRDIKEEVKKRRQTIKRLENTLKEEQDRIAGAEGAEHVGRLERREEIKTAAEQAKDKHTQHGTQSAELEQNKNDAFYAHEAAKQPVEGRKEELQRARRSLNDLQHSQGRPYASYRNNMEQLVQAVNRETRWRQKPVGPMGKHVRLQQPNWVPLIEKQFGPALDAFVVTNVQDQKMLADVMRRVRCEVSIFIGDPEPLNNINEPDPDVDTILRILSVDNALVRNQLIINQGIEQICLIASKSQAVDYLYSDTRPRPQYVKAAISIGNNGAGIKYEYTRTGAEKSTSIQSWRGPARMETDHDEQVRILQERIDQATRDLDGVTQQLREKQVTMEKANQEIKRWQREAQRLKTAAQQADDAVEEQTNRIESLRPQDGRLQELDKQLSEAKTDLESAQNSFQDAINEKDALDAKQSEVKRVVDEVQGRLDEAEARIAKAQKQVDRASHARTISLHEKNAALEAIDHAKQMATQQEAKRDAQRGRVEEFVEGATTVSRRVPVNSGLSMAAMDARIEKMEADRTRLENEAGGTPVQLAEAWKEAKLAYQEANNSMKDLTNFHATLKHTLGNRQYRWRMFRKYIAYRARFTFTYLLSERNFRGRVLMDHEEKQLDIAVEPDLSRSSDSGREARTLSGGEKSFSTICLLLSIWEAMGSPIRCLDEFDVFMDSVNRATSMTMMIGAARRSVGRQFILITPQSMNNVEMGDDVKVHRMSDPERGQGVLPFTQA
ncbi:hypothetical protein LTR36_007703 [Oleoguttula mirabilis]|uniref:RecF/RecN/SMC N-terminal domain-containing protein n=1 Tax=Oleoguttula mirabilis TaxID=1507867 RepID=A0AAV9JUI0_9PEZI|nr:hypothetical protein LTR36_007703 [Oleoguttula mirabilis]